MPPAPSRSSRITEGAALPPRRLRTPASGSANLTSAMRHILRTLTLILLAVPLAGAGSPPAGGEFTATATVETRQGTRSMGFTVVASRPMSREEVQPLKRVLAEGGQQALLNSIRGSQRGRLKLGGMEYPIDLVVAEAVKDGERYIVVTARSLRYEEVTEGSSSLDHPFTVFVFDVPGFGSGTGRIYTQAALSVDADDRVQVDQYDGKPGALKDVRRVR
jgi:hypothetical protein